MFEPFRATLVVYNVLCLCLSPLGLRWWYIMCCVVSLCFRLQDLFQQEKGRKRLSVPPSPGRHRQTDDSKVRVKVKVLMLVLWAV